MTLAMTTHLLAWPDRICPALDQVLYPEQEEEQGVAEYEEDVSLVQMPGMSSAPNPLQFKLYNLTKGPD